MHFLIYVVQITTNKMFTFLSVNCLPQNVCKTRTIIFKVGKNSPSPLYFSTKRYSNPAGVFNLKKHLENFVVKFQYVTAKNALFCHTSKYMFKQGKH